MQAVQTIVRAIQLITYLDGFPAVGAGIFKSVPDVVGDFLDRKALWGSR